jgi:hypothetical protein
MATLLHQERFRFLDFHKKIAKKSDDRLNAGDYAILTEALGLYQHLEGPISDQGIRFSFQAPWGKEEAKISHESLQKVSRENLTLPKWQEIICVLSWYYYQIENNSESEERRDQARAMGIKLKEHIFAYMDWGLSAETPKEKLQLKGRELAVFRFGGLVPMTHGIPGLQFRFDSDFPRLNQWLATGEEEYSYGKSLILYRLVYAFFLGTGVEEKEARSLIESVQSIEGGDTPGWDPQGRISAAQFKLMTEVLSIYEKWEGEIPAKERK